MSTELCLNMNFQYKKSKQNGQVATTTCRVWKYSFFPHMVSISKAGFAGASLSCMCSPWPSNNFTHICSLLTKHCFSLAFVNIFFKNPLPKKVFPCLVFLCTVGGGAIHGSHLVSIFIFNPDFLKKQQLCDFTARHQLLVNRLIIF